MSSSVKDTRRHLTEPSSVSAAQRSMSSVSACVCGCGRKPLMFCGLCCSNADWKCFSMVSKQTNMALHSGFHTTHCEKQHVDQNRRCPQKLLNEIRFLREETVLNYVSKQSGEVCFMNASRAKKKWNTERTKKIK